MEKYRKFADAATGINPFVVGQIPTRLSIAIASVLFPFRLIAALLCTLLLFPVDLLAYAFYATGLSFLSRAVFAPCQRALLRILLWSLGNLGVTRALPKASRLFSVDAAPHAGDVLLANMQSVWDMVVLEIAGPLPQTLVAYYTGKGIEKGTKESASSWRVFAPSPLQRWRVWAHVYQSGSVEFLRRALEDAAELDISALQQKGRRLGLPVVCFAEGSCSNGKGMLRVPALRVAAAPASVCVAALEYETAAVLTILPPRHWLAMLFAMSASLHGCRDPAWRSPSMPLATLRLATLSREAAGDTVEVTQPLCAASRARRPLSVGLREKLGYVEAYRSQMVEK